MILGSGSFLQVKFVEHMVDGTKTVVIFKTDLHLLVAISRVNLDKQASWFRTVKSPHDWSWYLKLKNYIQSFVFDRSAPIYKTEKGQNSTSLWC